MQSTHTTNAIKVLGTPGVVYIGYDPAQIL